jgi:hypothetical protein
MPQTFNPRLTSITATIAIHHRTGEDGVGSGCREGCARTLLGSAPWMVPVLTAAKSMRWVHSIRGSRACPPGRSFA